MVVGSGSYEADPTRMGASMSSMDAVSQEVLSIIEDFKSAYASFYGWAGNDQFGRQAQSQVQQVYEMLASAGEAIHEATRAVPDALRAMRNSIAATQQFANDNIQQGMIAQEGMAGGGKH